LIGILVYATLLKSKDGFHPDSISDKVFLVILFPLGLYFGSERYIKRKATLFDLNLDEFFVLKATGEWFKFYSLTKDFSVFGGRYSIERYTLICYDEQGKEIEKVYTDKDSVLRVKIIKEKQIEN
jgi:hypothetical protein